MSSITISFDVIYYVAHFKIIDLGCPSVGHMIWSHIVYHEYCVYAIDIYEYNKTDENKFQKNLCFCPDIIILY